MRTRLAYKRFQFLLREIVAVCRELSGGPEPAFPPCGHVLLELDIR